MKVETNTVTLRKLTPSEGMYLTQANLKENEERIFTQLVYLPEGTSEEDWKEITEEEKDAEFAKIQEQLANDEVSLENAGEML